MPYIKPLDRGRAVREPDTAGELNYAITVLLRNYWLAHTQNYQTINDIVGATEGAKAEFQRRVVVPYEVEKIKENSDVY